MKKQLTETLDRSFLLSFILGLTLVGLAACQPDKKEEATQNNPLTQSMEKGKVIYQSLCIACHLDKGQGLAGTFPPLAGADFLLQNREASIRAVKYGQQGELVVNGQKYNGVMAPLNLSDEQVRDVMNYVLHSWGNDGGAMVSLDEVKAVQKESPN